MDEPHVVDLRSPRADPSGAPAPSTGSRLTALAGLVVFVLGGALGWLLAVPSDPADDVPEAGETPVQEAAQQPDASALDSEAGARPGVADVPSLVPVPFGASSADPPPRRRIVEANVTVLAGSTELVGPVTLIPGVQSGARIRLAADGTVSVVDGAVASVPDGEFIGFALAEVAEGVLFVPTDRTLGAVTYWSRPGGIQIPVVEAPYDTSYLAAAGDLAVFLSEGDIVVRDMSGAEDVQRIGGRIADDTIVHACLSPDAAALALVASEGDIIVVDLDSGSIVAALSTGTSRFGISWAGPGQLVRLEPLGDAQLLVATDLESGASHQVARLEGGTGWRLTTEGTGC